MENLERTCKNCRFWFSGECDKINWLDSIGKDKAFIKADASDDTGMYAVLITAPDFGCVLFEERPAKKERKANK